MGVLTGISPLTKFLSILLIMFTLMGVGAYGGYRFELARYEQLVAADAKAFSVATKAAADDQHTRDQITLTAAQNSASAQAALAAKYQNLLSKEIAAHVSDSNRCISYGLVRVLNNAAGSAAYPIPDSTHEPDDKCAPVTWRSFAGDLTADYEASAKNSQQLTDLQSWILAQEAANRARSLSADEGVHNGQ